MYVDFDFIGPKLYWLSLLDWEVKGSRLKHEGVPAPPPTNP